MSGEASAIVGALFGFLGSAVAFVAYSLARTRERLARVEQQLSDQVQRDYSHDRGER